MKATWLMDMLRIREVGRLHPQAVAFQLYEVPPPVNVG